MSEWKSSLTATAADAQKALLNKAATTHTDKKLNHFLTTQIPSQQIVTH